MGIKNKRDAASHLDYVIKQINRMTTGNLEHHRNSIYHNLKKLENYLKEK